MIEALPAQRLGQERLGPGVVQVRIEVASALARGPAGGGVGVGDAVRDGQVRGRQRRVDGQHRGVALGGVGHVQDRLGQGNARLGPADLLGCAACGFRQQEGLGIGIAHVLGGAHQQAPGDEARVLAAADHPGQVVQRRVRIRAAQALLEGAGQIVMAVAAVVHDAPAQGVLEHRQVPLGQVQPGLQPGQGGAQIAPGPAGQPVQHLGRRRVGRRPLPFLLLPLLVGPGPVQHLPDRLGRQRAQGHELAAAAQGRVQVEGRVLGGGPHQDRLAPLQGRQQDVLLGPVEPVDLVQEQHRRHRPEQRLVPVLGQELLQLRRRAAGPGELQEGVAGGLGQDPGQGGLAGAGRPPQHHGRQPAPGGDPGQRPPGSQQVRLAHHVLHA